MPPKKDQQAVENKTLWGRPGNTLKMGIVGLPNVGKSTTFNLLSNQSVPAENYPFCTKEPNFSRVFVPDERFDKLCKIFKPKSEKPATLDIVDIAGLVPGASKGEGLGNAFLSHIRDVDGIYHVVRAFEDVEIMHTEIDVNPIRDLEIISTELILKDLDYATKRVEDITGQIKKQNNKESQAELAMMTKIKEHLEQNKWVRAGDFNAKEIEFLNGHLFLTAKPVVYLINLSAEDFKNKKNKWLKKIQDWVQANIQGPIIPYSADFEKTYFEESQSKKQDEEKKIEGEQQQQQQEVQKKETGSTTMLPKIIKVGYKSIDLIHFFTCGPDEVRCWTVREGKKAPQAAGVIHTDFEKGFICAEVMAYDDFMKYGSEQAVKAEGKYKQQGKEYVVLDGDIIFFRFNVSKDQKKK